MLMLLQQDGSFHQYSNVMRMLQKILRFIDMCDFTVRFYIAFLKLIGLTSNVYLND
jgi:hypothetical protein